MSFNKILEEIGITDKQFGCADFKTSLRTAMKANMKVYIDYDDIFKISLLQLIGGISPDIFVLLIDEAELVYDEMKR